MKRKPRIEYFPIYGEMWRPVIGYEGRYEVSNLGRVKSLPNKVNFGTMILNPAKVHGYWVVGLFKDNAAKNYLVHRLVAIAFLENDRNCTDVNHLDGNRANAQLSNLEWCTCGENHKHAFRTGLRHQNGDKNQSRKLNSIQVKEIISRYIPKIYTRKMICQDYNINISTVRDILNGESWSTVTNIRKLRGRKMALTNNQISEIKIEGAKGVTHAQIGKNFGVSQSYISNIINKKRRAKENIYE